MRRGLSRLAAALTAGLLLVVVTVLALVDRPQVTTPKSVASRADDGRRAAFLLLDRLGLAPRAWDERPGLLPRGRRLLWLPGIPVDPRERELGEGRAVPEREAADALDLVRASGLRSPRHYRGFLQQGGRLVVPLSTEMVAFLVDELGLDELSGCEVEALDPVPTTVELVGGQRLELALETAAQLVGLDPAVPRETLAQTPEGQAIALEIPVGRGGLVLLASDDFLANVRLREADDALFLVRLVEALAPGGGVWFDEHALGRWSEEGALELALGPDTRLASLHVLLLALLAVWLLAWPREFPRDPEPLEATAPLERARAQADLALRAGHPEVLAGFLIDGTLRRAARRLRVQLEEGERPADALARLAELASLDDRPARVARWSSDLFDTPVRDRDDLARLDAGLRALEAELGRHGRSPARTGATARPDPTTLPA